MICTWSYEEVSQDARIQDFGNTEDQIWGLEVWNSGILELWNPDDGGSCGLELMGPRFWKDIPHNHNYFCSGFEYIHVSSKAKDSNMQHAVQYRLYNHHRGP